MWTIWRIWQWRIRQKCRFWDVFFKHSLKSSYHVHFRIMFGSRTHCKILKKLFPSKPDSLCSKRLNKLNERDDGQPQFTRSQAQPVFVDRSNVITSGWFTDSKAYWKAFWSAIMAQAQTQGPTKGSSTITSLQWTNVTGSKYPNFEMFPFRWSVIVVKQNASWKSFLLVVLFRMYTWHNLQFQGIALSCRWRSRSEEVSL